jgi:hypothetical protein
MYGFYFRNGSDSIHSGRMPDLNSYIINSMDIKILKSCERKTLSKKRFLRTVNVMDTAVKLAGKFNFSDKKNEFYREI